MPGDYGPAGKWVHDRAHRIMGEGGTKGEYGKEKGKSVAYAISVQQAHKMGKTPKDFRTPQGLHEAKQKYDEPKGEYQKAAGGSAAALGAEVLGIPGTTYGGYREGGKRGALGAGGLGLVGLGAGLGARHLIRKYVTGGAFGQKHPLAATMLEALPLAVGTTVGGAAGSHLFGKHASIELNLPAFFDELAEIEKDAGPFGDWARRKAAPLLIAGSLAAGGGGAIKAMKKVAPITAKSPIMGGMSRAAKQVQEYMPK